MQDLMAALQEVRREDIEAYRSGGGPATPDAPDSPAEGAALAFDDIAVALAQAAVAADDALSLEAFKWATGMRDESLLVALAASLPRVVQEEQIRLYKASLDIAAAEKKEVQTILVNQNLLKSRMQVSAAFDDYLKTLGWTAGQRVPRHATTNSLTTQMWAQPATLEMKGRLVRRWHRTWQGSLQLQKTEVRVWDKRCHSAYAPHVLSRRKNAPGQGRPCACHWLRQELYEWFVTMRYSIDWEACERSLRSSGRTKCMGRFTRGLLRQKANQLLHDYCHQCFLHGVSPHAVQPSSRWFAAWAADYGVTMRKPNRKYKVQKAIMAERLEIGWCNVARVRALCLAEHGYDPELENWDQSPFHNNESGSQSQATLAVVGSTVPILEGHADTRARWTGNFTTFSNKERLMREGPPYCEFVFKAQGEVLQLKLREYIRSRGFGKWVTVATSPKGSYRTNDVLNVLDAHFPIMTQWRQWRIIMADDFSAHLSPQVFRLCWSRGYVFIAHGGGVTPVVQTPDTDLNQHVKRLYTALEVDELMRQMREGARVPRCRLEQCIDMMVEVMSKIELHLRAAEGYAKTGLTAALDNDSRDHLIVREAANFWEELSMRQKINSAVAEVREEHQAGRLKWSFENVQRLIREYPKHPHTDAVLARLGDDTWIDESESKFQDDDNETSDSDSSEEDDESVAEAADKEVMGCLLPTAPDEVGQEAEQDRSCGGAAGGHLGEGSSGSTDRATTDADAAALAAQSSDTIATLEIAMASLKEVGAMKAVVTLESEIRKCRRRLREEVNEDAEVMLALARHRDAQEAQQRERRRLVDQANERTRTAAAVAAQIKEADALLKKRKQAIIDAESILETKHVMNSFSLDDLGKGREDCGGKDGRTKRWLVLDRLAKLGQGLSASQRNDFRWWKAAWGKNMMEEHGANWPNMFAEWMQRVVIDLEEGRGNAFSLFVFSETRRCFDSEIALRLP